MRQANHIPPPFFHFPEVCSFECYRGEGGTQVLRRRAGRHQNLLPRQKKEFKKTTQPLISHTRSFDYIYIFLQYFQTAPAGARREARGILQSSAWVAAPHFVIPPQLVCYYETNYCLSINWHKLKIFFSFAKICCCV